MKIYVRLICIVGIAMTANRAWAHGFALSLVNDSQGNPIVITPASESTVLDQNGNPVGPENLFIGSFGGVPAANASYGVIHGFAYTTGAWPNYTATYNILSPLFFSDGTVTGPMAAVPATSATYINIFDRNVGLFPGAAAGNVQLSGATQFVPGYGVSLLDPHELQKQLFLGADPVQTYGEYGFSYEVSVTLPGGQLLTTGPLVDVFATDIGSGGFYSNAPTSQQDAATEAIYHAAIAFPESWNYNGNGNYSDSAKWYQTIPNGLGFTVAFGGGVTTAVTAPAISVTIDRAVYAGTLNFTTATTSYSLASDGVDGHGLVLNNNGVGAGVNVTAGSHAISAGLTLADASGTTFTIAQGSSLTLSGAVEVESANPTVTLNGAGLLRILNLPTLPASAALLINGGTLQFDATSGSPTIGSGVTVNVGPMAMLELAGSVSALSSEVNVVNDGAQASGGGLIVSGTNQEIGNLDGTGDLLIAAGADLTANYVIQGSLTIEGTALSHGLLTIAASDATLTATSLARTASVPEPASMTMAGVAAAAIMAFARWRCSRRVERNSFRFLSNGTHSVGNQARKAI